MKSRREQYDDDFDLAADLQAHDDLVARRGLDIWIGAEPTFTRRESTDPWWLTAAEGGDKLERAHALASALTVHVPHARLTRVIGRQYPGEAQPRFCWGVRWPRDDNAPQPFSSPAHLASPAIASPDDLADEQGILQSHWLTVTPDPGVVEVNQAPAASALDFARQARAVWSAANTAGLSPLRYRFNGDVADSGGGGQLTFGGPSATSSPFVRYPHLLPALVRYVNNHPGLSYWFAGECVGSASQAPRADEGVRERWDELAVALPWLEAQADRGELTPELAWKTLAPLLVDAAGNSHRAEINIEKLWNPYFSDDARGDERAAAPVLTNGKSPRHGRMGVVELRAHRMPTRPTQLAAAAALWRSVIARLIVDDYRAPLIDWHDDLHDRFALPRALRHDLEMVLGDIAEHGLGLTPGLIAEIASWRDPGLRCRLGDATLELSRAVEFWPLLGDVASQERSAARLVDASTERWELLLDAAPNADIDIIVDGQRVRIHALPGIPDRPIERAIGIRRRIYQPSVGLHPGLPALDPLVIEWAHDGATQRIELWSWRAEGGGYPGMPIDGDDAATRRTERIIITPGLGTLHSAGTHTSAAPFTIDLRRRQWYSVTT